MPWMLNERIWEHDHCRREAGAGAESPQRNMLVYVGFHRWWQSRHLQGFTLGGSSRG
jgi:hypothetical protein